MQPDPVFRFGAFVMNKLNHPRPVRVGLATRPTGGHLRERRGSYWKRTNHTGLCTKEVNSGITDGNCADDGTRGSFTMGDNDVGGDGAASDPFLRRLKSIIETWVGGEWQSREAVRFEAAALGWTKERKDRYRNRQLTAIRLAAELDNISLSKLRRELDKLGAPPPAVLIRSARIAHARHLLSSTRLLVREIANRSGYRDEKHFILVFSKETGMTPSQYRRSRLGVRNRTASHGGSGHQSK